MRAAWHKEPLKGGSYAIIIHEIPFQVQKSKLIEKIADLMQNRKLPLIGDIQDESAEDLRIVIQPKNRSIEAEHIMAHLFKITDLETRFSMNMNVLDQGKVPKVMSLKEILEKWLAHRRIVMINCQTFRLGEIAARLNILAAYLIAYRHLDLIIKIIRESDEPREALMQQLKISQDYAETILNMRLRQLRSLEEKTIIKEEHDLRAEKAKINLLLNDETALITALKGEIFELKKLYDQPRDQRLTKIEEISNEADEILQDILIEREPITVLYSQKDWIRSVKTHLAEDYPHRFKDGDAMRFSAHCDTTDQFLIVTSAGKFYTLSADKIPSGRGMGEPIRLMLDLEATDKIVSFSLYNPEKSYLLVSNDGLGFIVRAEKLFAQTRSGKQIMVLKNNAELAHCLEIEETMNHLGIIGTNRRLLIFPTAQISELSRGQGVVLQKYKPDEKLADIQLFNPEQGLRYKKAAKIQTLENYDFWLGKRAQVGKLPPSNFPLKNGFNLGE